MAEIPVAVASTAKIVGWGTENARACASAARISTMQGDALQAFSRAGDPEKDGRLVGKVMASGHRSVVEHATFTIAFCNVSAFVEQFFIEFRLASFTVKSRRYVDFGGMGYYVPRDLGGGLLARYTGHIDGLFADYRALVEMGIPKEDARFVLPYAFFSNFYCTLNARELLHILEDMLLGRGRFYPELVRLGQMLLCQLQERFPHIANGIAARAAAGTAPPPAPAEELAREAVPGPPRAVRAAARLVEAPQNPAQRLARAWLVQRGLPLSRLQGLAGEPTGLVDSILSGGRPRELEQLCYTFLIENISLAGLTHMARHRMQSLIVPPLAAVTGENYVVPQSVRASAAALGRYEAAFARTQRARDTLAGEGLPPVHGVYLNLSGNTLDILTTINARELLVFLKLRCCNRAQWEIRGIAGQMLCALREGFPALFERMGPSCAVEGRCPEGRLSCGHPAGV